MTCDKADSLLSWGPSHFPSPNPGFRGRMMLASLEAGLAFSNASLGAVHAMAHSLGGMLDAPQSECNALLLPRLKLFWNMRFVENCHD